MLKTCQNPECGKLFHAERKSAKYCSTKCRVAAHRSRCVPVVPDKPPVIEKRTRSVVDDISMLVNETRQIGSDYIGLVNTAPLPLRAGCERVGTAIFEALEREGW